MLLMRYSVSQRTLAPLSFKEATYPKESKTRNLRQIRLAEEYFESARICRTGSAVRVHQASLGGAVSHKISERAEKYGFIHLHTKRRESIYDFAEGEGL